jgi:predicted small lipoprotein YifL
VILIVKSIIDLLLHWSAKSGVIVLAGLLVACGQKGPLYLPAKPQAGAPAQPAQTNPAPDQSTSPASK